MVMKESHILEGLKNVSLFGKKIIHQVKQI